MDGGPVHADLRPPDDDGEGRRTTTTRRCSPPMTSDSRATVRTLGGHDVLGRSAVPESHRVPALEWRPPCQLPRPRAPTACPRAWSLPSEPRPALARARRAAAPSRPRASPQPEHQAWANPAATTPSRARGRSISRSLARPGYARLTPSDAAREVRSIDPWDGIGRRRSMSAERSSSSGQDKLRDKRRNQPRRAGQPLCQRDPYQS